MAALLTNQTTDTTGSDTEETGPVGVQVSGVLAGACVYLEARYSTLEFTSIGKGAAIRDVGFSAVNLQGTYDIRAKLVGATAATNVTVATST